MATYVQKRYLDRKIRQVCTTCGKRPKGKFGLRCNTCAQTRRNYAHKRRQQSLNLGHCVGCHTRAPKPGKTRCTKCCKNESRRAIAKYYERKKTGICVRCGTTRSLATIIHCFPCWIKMAATTNGTKCNAKGIRIKWTNQKGTCAYTGIKLIPGGNASLDHILPKSRGGTDATKNLQWVDKQVNTAKYNLNHSEFIQLCRRVTENYSG